MPLVRPIILTAVLVAAAWIVAGSPLRVVTAQTQVVGSGPYRAGLVVRFADGQVETRCVAFEEQEIGGDELLRRSGINGIVLSPEGAVCSINGKGCPSDNCFCQCPFPNCEYWAYYHRENDIWNYSQDGAFYAVIRDGSLDGWSWGQGNFQEGVEPPQMNFEDVCPETASAATATATTQASPSPPQVSFFTASTTLSSGQCTMLTWQTTGATSVTLDGTSVAFQGSQQVCPIATQSFTLIAANDAGQTTTRQVNVTVQSTGAGDAQPTATWTVPPTPVAVAPPTSRPTVGAPRQATPTAGVRTSRPVITQAPLPLPGATVAGAFPLPPTPDFQGGGVPLAPTSEPLPVIAPSPQPTATPFQFALPPTETPRPRRVLSANDPTPTPILVARVEANTAGGAAQSASSAPAASSATSGSAQDVQSRSFSPDLLPGYAAYIGSVAVLLMMGWYMLRRRHEPVRAGKDE